LIRPQLYDRPFAPAILAAGKCTNLAQDFGVTLRGQHAGVRTESPLAHPYLDCRIGPQVLQPVRSVKFRDDVEATIALREPDFDFPRQAGLPAARREVEVLAVADVTAP